MSHQNEEVGKLFVGGLSWETTQDSLCRYFSRFGEVIDCVVMKNNETGRSRGFGFVTFKDPSCVQIVLSSAPHNLDGRTIDPKACNPRSMQKLTDYNRHVSNTQTKKGNNFKIFLGGLPSNVTETDLKNFFSKYGKVSEVVIMYDQEKKRSRGFGFLSYETEDSVEQVCAEHYVNINNKQVECKRAEPRDGRSGGKQAYQWNGMGVNMGMGPGGMPPPHMGGPIGGPGMGPPPMGPATANGMAGGMMAGGYPSGGWGAPPQGYGQDFYIAGYGAPPPNTGYPNWGTPGGYGPYGTPGPQYGPPQGYAGYGYGWGSPSAATTAGPSPTAPGTAASSTSQETYNQAAGENGNSANQSPGLKSENTSATNAPSPGANQSSTPKQQQEFSVGTAYGWGGNPGDSSQTTSYSGSQGTGYSRSGTQSQGYHPYRRQ